MTAAGDATSSSPPGNGPLEPRTRAAQIGLVAGPLLALLFWTGPHWGFHLDPARPQLNLMAAAVALMACWWLTEAIPMAATALVPLVAFPLLKIMPGSDVAASYGHHVIFLFLGGFLIALAIEESGLHRRIALTIVAGVGDEPRRVVAGFMFAAAVLSMWISNTATAMMMLPIAVSVLAQADAHGGDRAARRNFGVALLLGVAYGASIGGAATLIGTPPNISLAGIYEKTFPDLPQIGFFHWMVVALPISATMLVLAWALLALWLFPVGRKSLIGGASAIHSELAGLGPMSSGERRVGAIFLTTALLWILREPVEGYGWAPWLELENWVNDGTSAMLMALCCFLVPAGNGDRRPLLNWEATVRVPWGLLLLFGGGLALASGMNATGLDAYLGDLRALARLGDGSKMGLLALGMIWLTELTSNLASVNMLLPVLAEAALQLKLPPLMLMVPATLAASCAFMLPVATPPNAIVYGSGRIRIGQMVRAGICLNLLGTLIITVTAALLGPLVLW